MVWVESKSQGPWPCVFLTERPWIVVLQSEEGEKSQSQGSRAGKEFGSLWLIY